MSDVKSPLANPTAHIPDSGSVSLGWTEDATEPTVLPEEDAVLLTPAKMPDADADFRSWLCGLLKTAQLVAERAVPAPYEQDDPSYPLNVLPFVSAIADQLTAAARRCRGTRFQHLQESCSQAIGPSESLAHYILTVRDTVTDAFLPTQVREVIRSLELADDLAADTLGEQPPVVVDPSGQMDVSVEDIPPLSTHDGTWIDQKETAKRSRLSLGTLANARSDGQKAKDGLSGIDTRRRMWRKLNRNSPKIWYYVSSLS